MRILLSVLAVMVLGGIMTVASGCTNVCEPCECNEPPSSDGDIDTNTEISDRDDTTISESELDTYTDREKEFASDEEQKMEMEIEFDTEESNETLTEEEFGATEYEEDEVDEKEIQEIEQDIMEDAPQEREEEEELSSHACDGSYGTTYFVRPDGGTAEQCTGLVDAPYPGSGSNMPCAFKHPFIALPPGGTPLLQPGDRLIIAQGEYRMGYGGGTEEFTNCESAGTWECMMPPIPSGPDPEHPTCILGKGWNEGCSNPPQLFAAERPWVVINLNNSSNVNVECLEITDHSGCVYAHSGGLECPNWYDYPHGEYGDTGLSAHDSEHITLRHLDIHGFPSTGIHAYRIGNWLIEDVRISGNGWAGWDGDSWGESGGTSNWGEIVFRRVEISWNGCGESYPEREPQGCWAQTAGGYGDGLGTGETGGNWIFEECNVSYNTSDGIDLLYKWDGGTVEIDRTRAEGNAGNQIKITGPSVITNSIIIGNCAFFENQPFTYNVDPCRAYGNSIAYSLTEGANATLVNSTVYGEGDMLIEVTAHDSCNGSESVISVNNIFIGDEEFLTHGADRAVLFYVEGCNGLSFHQENSIVFDTRDNDYFSCASPGTNSCEDPLLVGPLSGMNWNVVPTESSPAIDAGLSESTLCEIPDHDFAGNVRPLGNGVDIGAYEQ